MTDHAWAQDHIAAYVAGGLDGSEAERLEAHARECRECTAAVDESRALDRGLESLFAPVKPAAALEDRMIHSLHVIRAGEVMRRGWKRNLLWGVAASVGLAVTGAGMSELAFDNRLPFQASSFGTKQSPRQGLLAILGLPASDGDGVFTTVASAKAGSAIRGPEEMALEMRDGFPRGSMENWGLASGRSDLSRRISGAAVTDGLSNTLMLGESLPSLADNKAVGGLDITKSGENLSMFKAETAFVPGEYRSNVGGHANDSRTPIMPALTAKPEPEKVDVGAVVNLPKDYNIGRIETLLTPKLQPPEKVNNKPNAAAPADPAPSGRKIIRSGDIEFEIESFDSAVASVIKLVTSIKGGYVATVNSEKLANGKVKGSVVVRVPPEALDSLVLDLRRDLGKGGELKGQRIGSQDITKQYTDLESRLKAARTMEQRLLQIIKDGKGEIKQLLEAEKELGVWRTKIEEGEGELRYFANQVSLSTLTIALAEKEIKTAAGLTESERVQAGVEVEDVEKAQQQLLAAISEAKGRITKSELKQLGAGQFNATMNFETVPEQAGPLRDRLRQLGTVTRLEIDRTQQAEGGMAPKDGKVKRGDTIFAVQLYNVAGMTPRESTSLSVAAPDVPAAFRTLQDIVVRAKGRVLKADLNEHDRLNVTAEFHFDVRRGEEGAVEAALVAAGDIASRTVSRAEATNNTTDAKVRFLTKLVSAAALPPRETTTLGVEVRDVEQTAAAFAAHVGDAKGRVVQGTVSHERDGRILARLIYDVPLAAAAGLAERFKSAGTVRVQQTNRNPQAHDGKLALARLDVTLSNAELIIPRDDGLWPQVRKGLSYSAHFLLLSLTWLIFGLCVVLPWGVVGYGGYRLVRRLFRSPTPQAPTA